MRWILWLFLARHVVGDHKFAAGCGQLWPKPSLPKPSLARQSLSRKRPRKLWPISTLARSVVARSNLAQSYRWPLVGPMILVCEARNPDPLPLDRPPFLRRPPPRRSAKFSFVFFVLPSIVSLFFSLSLGTSRGILVFEAPRLGPLWDRSPLSSPTTTTPTTTTHTHMDRLPHPDRALWTPLPLASPLLRP